ncbi:putative Store-operated calcium entry-associated regulatory factor [Paratrimastix pyriformis]|uniref:Store-operated calcium entry-associated regulatory factor n=1 Tax=Paratrimastix pyriformis TaxID=342808 RepID=A0ABQ8UUC9_9EUKA|nr:putative Store-operated calcium entry-associated regulatory factor [Paratrimastix pyriformis]
MKNSHRPLCPTAVSLAIVSVLLFVSLGAAKPAGKKILLEDVKVITLNAGSMTTARRGSAVPQLKCVGGSASHLKEFYPSTVQCTNQGSDGRDVQWHCTSDMEDTVKFGALSVSCEGYDYPDDQYILPGSCGLEYKLELTEKGRRHETEEVEASKWSHRAARREEVPVPPPHYDNRHFTDYHPAHSHGGKSLLFWMLFIGGVIAVVRIYKRRHAAVAPGPPAQPPMGMGMGGMGSQPSYYPSTNDFPAPSAPPAPSSCAPTYVAPTVVAPSHSHIRSMVGAGLLGYLWGRGRQNTVHPPQRGFFAPAAPAAPAAPVYTHTRTPSPPRHSSPPRTREASGFAGTSRR